MTTLPALAGRLGAANEPPQEASLVGARPGATEDPGRSGVGSARAQETPHDRLELSAGGLQAAREASDEEAPEPGAAPEEETGPDGLTEEDRQAVRKLQSRDREVRAHEQAHKAAGGDLASAPSYEFERGPDGNRYAVGGEVSISLREGDTPQETAQIARRVRRAALAPAQPSAQDQRVAAQASQLEQEAQAELAEERRSAADEASVEGNERTPVEPTPDSIPAGPRAARGAEDTPDLGPLFDVPANERIDEVRSRIAAARDDEPRAGLVPSTAAPEDSAEREDPLGDARAEAARAYRASRGTTAGIDVASLLDVSA